MKLNILIIASAVGLLTACGGANETSDKLAKKVAEEVSEITNEIAGNAIEIFNEEAAKEADKVIELTEFNMGKALETAAKYEACIVVVENHTLVKVVDLKDCKKSGSWTACMPMCEGFIKKGDLQPKKDYMNNIIGRPDKQKRTMYLFK